MIEHNTVLRLLLPAETIPTGSTVTKPSGSQEYILSHSLRVYADRKDDLEGFTVSGFFLQGPSGSINQVPGDKVLCWNVKASALVDFLESEWETDQ
jgi:hypothetical protein